MGMQESRGKIASSTKDLSGMWSNTKLQWNDANAMQFEEQVLKMLEQDVRSATQAMDQMGVLLTQIRRECSE
jgi:hypothetical protein